MIRVQLSRLYWWLHGISERQRMRKRLATLENRLAAHEMDMEGMEHFPAQVQTRMNEHRAWLVKQIELARRFV